MTPQNSTAAGILEHFPDDWHVVVEMCRVDEDFRELCDHYTECATVLERLQSRHEIDLERVAEYEQLTRELKREIRSTIDAAA